MRAIIDIAVWTIPFWIVSAGIFTTAFMLIRKRERYRAQVCRDFAKRAREKAANEAVRSVFSKLEDEREMHRRLIAQHNKEAADWEARAGKWERGEL